MQGTLWRRSIVLAIGVIAFATAASTATADKYFHTAHLDLSRVGNAPLKSGFVNDIHTNGSQIAALERYQLNGAAPSTTYGVVLNISFTDPTCPTPADLTIQSATFTTNGSGNGEADFTFPQTGPWPPPKPPALQTVYIQWVISDAAGPEFETGCIPVVLGG
jgi:hypothetical protein